MTSADFNVYQWIDGDSGATMKEFSLSLHTSTGQCINFLYVIAFTTGAPNTGADQVYRIELWAKGVTKVKGLPNLPGDDYLELKDTYGSWVLNIILDCVAALPNETYRALLFYQVTMMSGVLTLWQLMLLSINISGNRAVLIWMPTDGLMGILCIKGSSFNWV